MDSGRPSLAHVAALFAIAMLMLGGIAAPVRAADPLASLPFRVGVDGLFEAPSVGAAGDPGTWSFERGRMVNGQLQLHFEISPAPQTLAVQSGPAVLFGKLDLYGDAGGDIGLGISVPGVARVVLPACKDDAACHYSADITIPTKELAASIRDLEREGSLMSIDATFTLVRTFGGGTWLQVLGLHGVEGAGGGFLSGGRLGAMEPSHGNLSQTGLFPAVRAQPVLAGENKLDDPLDYGAIVEELLSKAGDVSTPIPTVHTELHVWFLRGCLGWSVLEFHDFDGNLLFYEDELMGKALINGVTEMPVGRPYWVTVEAGGGIRHPMIQLGPITSDGSDGPVITATLDCATRTGTLALVGALGPTPSPRPTSAASSATALPPSPVASGDPTGTPGASPIETTTSTTTPWLLVGSLGLGLLLVVFVLLRRRPVRS